MERIEIMLILLIVEEEIGGFCNNGKSGNMLKTRTMRKPTNYRNTTQMSKKWKKWKSLI